MHKHKVHSSKTKQKNKNKILMSLYISIDKSFEHVMSIRELQCGLIYFELLRKYL
jgi:hypothetical protein